MEFRINIKLNINRKGIVGIKTTYKNMQNGQVKRIE